MDERWTLATCLGLVVSCTASLFAQSPTTPADVNDAFDVADSRVQDLVIDTSPSGELVTTRIELPDGRELTLELRKHSIRSDKYQVLVEDGSGRLAPFAPPAVVTYKGVVNEDSALRVRASYYGEQLHAVILGPEESWAVQPVATAIPGASTTLHIVHASSDAVRLDGTCGVTATGGGSTPAGGPGPGELEICEIALDADYLYYLDLGSNPTSVINDLETIMNSVEGTYDVPDILIQYEVTTIVIRTSTTYTASGAGSRLDQFRDNWVSLPESGIDRDVTHLFTGQNLSGSTIGVAWLSVICSFNSGYGLSQSRYTSNLIYRTSLTAHELGHNWSSPHCNGADPCRIMCSANGGCDGLNPLEFGPASINPITAHKATRSCLHPQPPTLTAPFEDEFDSLNLSNDLWSYISGATVSTLGLGEPSAPYSMRLNAGSSSDYHDDDIRSAHIDLTSIDNPTVQFTAQHIGVSSGGELIIEYWSLTQDWIEIDTLVSDGSDMTSYTTHIHGLSWSAKHAEFRLRFRVDVEGPSENWFVDNVTVTDGAPIPTDPPTISTILPQTGPMGGGTPITIFGQNFANNATVLVGVHELLDFQYINSAEIRGTTPTGLQPGGVDVTVGQVSGSDTLSEGFIYSSNTLAIQSGDVAPGGSLELHAIATNDLPLGGYSFGGVFDSSRLTLDLVDTVGTDAEDADFVAPNWSNAPGDSWFTIGVVLDLVPPIEEVLPPGTSNSVARLSFTAAPSSPLDSNTLVEPVDAVGAPPVTIVFTLEGGVSAIPTLFWGVVTFVDSQFIRGDGNGDLSVNIADPIANLDYQFNLGPVLCFDAYDVNDDGVIDISDPIYNLSYQFTFGPAPLPPFPAAGSDPTPDTLSCD